MRTGSPFTTVHTPSPSTTKRNALIALHEFIKELIVVVKKLIVPATEVQLHEGAAVFGLSNVERPPNSGAFFACDLIGGLDQSGAVLGAVDYERR
jgi:hypothetical protein